MVKKRKTYKVYSIAKRALTLTKKQNIKYRNLQHFIGFTIVDKGEAMFLRVKRSQDFRQRLLIDIELVKE